MDLNEYNLSVRKWGSHLIRFINYSIKDMDATKDITQDTFIVLWEKRQDVNIEKVKQFLFTVAFRKLINYKRTIKNTEDINENNTLLSIPNQVNFDDKQAIEVYMDNLPTIQKQVLILRDIEGYNYKEIEEIMKLSESQVKVYLFRARLQLKESYKKEDLKISMN